VLPVDGRRARLPELAGVRIDESWLTSSSLPDVTTQTVNRPYRPMLEIDCGNENAA
jgi:hypothetical protein